MYAIQTAKLPRSIYDVVDKCNRGFLEGDTEEKKNFHLVKWKKVCKPKTFRGLSIVSMRHMNTTLLSKLGWRLLNSPDSLWAKTVQGKYFKQKSNIQALTHILTASSIWRSIVHGPDLLKERYRWISKNGKNVNF